VDKNVKRTKTWSKTDFLIEDPTTSEKALKM